MSSPENLECKSFCEMSYRLCYNHYLSDKTDTESNQAKARKYAIGKTASEAMLRFPDLEPNEIWKIISKIHVKWYCQLELEPEVVEKILSARQSWVKASGHAFEEMVKEECNKSLRETDIIVLLQRDLSALLKKNKITNLSRDITWLKDVCAQETFDLFVCKKEEGGFFRVFGCVQAKTSVRDRVTRDREPSIVAMSKKFWSIVFVFDADFLHQPKFIAMVNGDHAYGYDTNGWHFAYSYDSSFNEGRIRYVGEGLSVFVSDAITASHKFTGEERAFRTSDYPSD